MISFDNFLITDGSPIYLQILLYIKRGIIAGIICDGDELPSRRVLSALLGVNPNTVQKAYKLLEDEGLIITRGTLGKFVTSDTDLISRVKKEMQNETLRAWLAEMRAVGITSESIIEFINNEGGNV